MDGQDRDGTDGGEGGDRHRVSPFREEYVRVQKNKYKT